MKARKRKERKQQNICKGSDSKESKNNKENELDPTEMNEVGPADSKPMPECPHHRKATFPSQHASPQTDAPSNFKGTQNRTNKFTSFQVNSTTNSIRKQLLEVITKRKNNQNPTYNFNSTETRLGL